VWYSSLHPFAWHGPYTLLHINFGPARSTRLAGSRPCQDKTFKGSGRYTFTLPQVFNETGQVLPIQRGQMLGTSLDDGQGLLETVDWVFMRIVPAAFRPIKNCG